MSQKTKDHNTIELITKKSATYFEVLTVTMYRLLPNVNNYWQNIATIPTRKQPRLLTYNRSTRLLCHHLNVNRILLVDYTGPIQKSTKSENNHIQFFEIIKHLLKKSLPSKGDLQHWLLLELSAFAYVSILDRQVPNVYDESCLSYSANRCLCTWDHVWTLLQNQL